MLKFEQNYDYITLSLFVLKRTMIRYLKIIILLVILNFLNACNTVTGTVEGTGRGVIKDVKTFHHYSTCIFTDTQCGDLDLKK